jgi:hypothetical protein
MSLFWSSFAKGSYGLTNREFFIKEFFAAREKKHLDRITGYTG